MEEKVEFQMWCCQLVSQTNADVSGIVSSGPIAGHVGDGNFHCLMVVDPTDQEELQKVHLFSERLAR